MIPSQTAEYALRALAWMATRPPDQSVFRASDLSRETGIPAHYASKVLRRLVAGGMLRAQKGHGGGFSLSRPPDQIRFLDVLIASGSWPETDHCAFGWGACDAAHPCPLHHSWSDLKLTLQRWATTSTLADVKAYASQIGESGRPPKPRAARKKRP
jgi:Rrf2 family protein